MKMKNEKRQIRIKNDPAVAGYRTFSFFVFHSSFQQRGAGFTLLEMIISIGIFSTLVIAAIGITIGISNAQIKASVVQATQDNIRFSMELMTKEMRTGSQYELSAFCAGEPGEEIRFTASSGRRHLYYRSGTSLMRLVDSTNCSVAQPLLSEEVAVANARFTIGGTGPGAADGQPWVMVSLSIRSQGPKPVLDSQMDLQTTVVQRFRDQ
ncbi:MAG: type II secretion system protein [Patescibacteria group bacterium]